jgi:hypothetical protein
MILQCSDQTPVRDCRKFHAISSIYGTGDEVPVESCEDVAQLGSRDWLWYGPLWHSPVSKGLCSLVHDNSLGIQDAHLCKIPSTFVEVVVLVTCTHMFCVWISTTTVAVLTDVSCGFCLSVQANAGIEPQLGQNCFLLNFFKFILHHSANHSTLFHLTYWHKITINKEVCESFSLVITVSQREQSL